MSSTLLPLRMPIHLQKARLSRRSHRHIIQIGEYSSSTARPKGALVTQCFQQQESSRKEQQNLHAQLIRSKTFAELQVADFGSSLLFGSMRALI